MWRSGKEFSKYIHYSVEILLNVRKSEREATYVVRRESHGWDSHNLFERSGAILLKNQIHRLFFNLAQGVFNLHT